MKKNTRPGQVRIIAGQWRSRRLPVADIAGLRPTTDRVRERLFNWLQQDLIGARCLDLFAGSGALGFEAASRGAAQVQMIERDRKAVQMLQQSADLLNADQVNILQADAMSWLQNETHQAYDIIFLDPPFDLKLLPECLKLLRDSGCLQNSSLIYVEQAAPSDKQSQGIPSLNPQEYDRLRQGCTNDVHYSLIRVKIE